MEVIEKGHGLPGHKFIDDKGILAGMSYLRTENELIDKHLHKEKERFMLQKLIMPRKKAVKMKDGQKVDMPQTESGFFTYFNDANFENKELPAMLEDERPFSLLMREKNMFNQALLSGLSSEVSAANKPDPIFGAAHRLKPLSSLMGSDNGLQNPFNISFELPPLPNLDFLPKSNENSNPEFNFFSNFTSRPAKKALSPQRSPAKVQE